MKREGKNTTTSVGMSSNSGNISSVGASPVSVRRSPSLKHQIQITTHNTVDFICTSGVMRVRALAAAPAIASLAVAASACLDYIWM